MSPRDTAVLQLVHANHREAEAGHRRLREDWRGHDDRLDKLESSVKDLAYKVQAVSTMPQDLSKLSLSPGIVISIVLAVVGIVTGQVATTWGMRSDIRDISTRVEAQTTHNQDAQKLLEERFRIMGVQIDGIVKKQELNQLEIQNLRETILGRRSTR